MMDVNGSGATAAVGNPTGLTPGGQQAVGSTTSVPGTGLGCTDDISLCLSTPETSSGTFVLPPGTDTISGTLVATAGPGGVMDFIVEPKPATTTVPEPATWLLLSSALLGFGVARRRNRHA